MCIERENVFKGQSNRFLAATVFILHRLARPMDLFLFEIWKNILRTIGIYETTSKNENL